MSGPPGSGNGAEAHVELKRVTKRYGAVTAISDLSLCRR